MSEKYIASDKIKVFPSSLRTQYSDGKFTTEANLTKFLKSVTDNGSFAIADPYGTGTHQDSSNYSFVINGFYFNITDVATINALIDDAEITNVYAYIKVDTLGRLIGLDDETNLDYNNSFKALCISTTEPTGDNIYYLDLKSADRFAKFSTDTFYRSTDGKNLTEVLADKQPLIEAGNEDRQLNLGKNSEEKKYVKGILEVENGGTGASEIDDIRAGAANKLKIAGSEDPYAVGSTTQPVYFEAGIPKEVTLTSEASKLSSAKDTPYNIGSETQPIYFKNGMPTIIPVDSKVNIKAKSLQGSAGGIDTSVANAIAYTPVYFNSDGVATNSITIHVSKDAPDSESGKFGDLWFKYKEN